jgi:hypothetical protein
VLTGADTLTTFDTTTFTPVPYSCGLDDQFMPMLIVSGTQPDVLYCTGAGNLEPNGTVSVITFA